ncbi:MAG: adenine phosphoribosyltransferase [Gammaproteobacteria bacterium]|nr:adenine phosphoribosyltransferase [Gammaproteobacteria bacterium]NNF62187.1 adenine phosphoribosyltransferase [Gammaproteobacteria bacterium]NNM20128.1 adenine phosphoribosyltransferase [Gammaproteobacteria bacterium]
MTLEQLRELIRDVPDFPRAGVIFKDITPLLAHAPAFRRTVDMLRERLESHPIDCLLAIESRGFIFAAPVAASMGLPLQLIRKPGKLPHQTVSVSYELEYGSDALEMHVDAIDKGKRCAIIDDVIATGGSAEAAAKLVAENGGDLVCCAFVIELAFLAGRNRLDGYQVESLIRYDG